MQEKSWECKVKDSVWLILGRIMVANSAMDYDKIKIYGTKVKVDSMESVA